jgi:hypothetical protein
MIFARLLYGILVPTRLNDCSPYGPSKQETKIQGDKNKIKKLNIVRWWFWVVCMPINTSLAQSG